MTNFVVDVFGIFFFYALRIALTYQKKRNLRLLNGVGQSVTVGSELAINNQGFITIGDNCEIADRVLFSCYKGGSIVVGSNCFIGDNVKVVADSGSVKIGNNCLLAENVSIRASNHGTRLGQLIRLQNNIVKNISIGHDCWIGKGVTVLAGSFIADGCVIGANSVVRGVTEPNTIYAGVPIKKIKIRNEY